MWSIYNIAATYNFGFKWRLDLPGLQLEPVDMAEEQMIFDSSLSILSTPEAFGGVFCEKLETNTTIGKQA